MISVSDFLDLSKNALVQWSKARNEFNSVRNELAVIAPTSVRTSEHSNVTDVPTARRRDDGDDAYKGNLKQGYTKNFTQAEIALQVDVTKQMRKFDKYDEIMKKMRAMGRAAERRMELDIASLLSYAWSTSYTNIDGETVTTSTPDAVAMISASHTMNGASGNYSNEIATTHSPISNDILESLEEVGNGFKDDDGRGIPAEFTHIITGRHAPTVHEVQKILGTMNNQSGTTDFNKNTFANKYQHLIVPFLDYNAQTEARDSDKYRYCFLANLTNKDMNGFRIEQSQDIQFENPEQVFESSVWQFLTTALYDFGLTRAQFIVGTKGDGTSV